jgi:hypothetical protein
MKILLYHGTTDEALESILTQRRFKQSEGIKHYLGKGLYFYDDFNHARVWAVMKAKRFGSQPAVIQCLIDVPEEYCLDLDHRAEQDFFFKERNKYIRRIRQKRLEVKAYTDSNFCDFIAKRLSIKLISKTFVYVHPKERQIRYVFSNEKIDPFDVTRIYRTEKQYCIKDQGIITDIREIKMLRGR